MVSRVETFFTLKGLPEKVVLLMDPGEDVLQCGDICAKFMAGSSLVQHLGRDLEILVRSVSGAR